MGKKQLFYCIVILGLLRLGWSLYSTMSYPLFSRSNYQPHTYTLLSEYYQQEFKTALEKDIDNITDDICVNNSELDRYIGLVLAKKEERDPGFTKRNSNALAILHAAVIDYVCTYRTLLNQKNSDVNPKAGKREIRSCMRKAGYEKVKPLLDDLMDSRG